MTKVEISVIVPIYKIEKYLPKCIESLLEQSFLNFELILVDDGSPDNCSHICDDYAKKDSRIKVIHKENGGLLSARKAGVKNAKGKYISFVDGDDWVDKYYLDILYKLAEVNSADLVVTGQYREFDGKIETIKPKNVGVYNAEDIRSKIIPEIIYNGKFCEHGMSTYVWNKLYKRSLLEKIINDVPNDIVMGEDAAITYSYVAICKKLVISEIALYYYRQRYDSIVKSIDDPEIEYYRLGLLMNFLEKKLSLVFEKTILNKHLKLYLYSQILVRSGGVILNDLGEVIYNPFLDTKRNSRIAVYSSGSFGQHILTTNVKTKYFKIAKWIDVDYHELIIDGNHVKPISALNNSEFDYLLIATISQSTYQSIKNKLSQMGIKKEKIAKINTNQETINKLLIDIGFNEHFIFKKNKINQPFFLSKH